MCSMLAPSCDSGIRTTNMQRLIARFLLLFALVGTFLPLAFAVTAAPVHACCLRKAVHQCHEADQLAFRCAGCCNRHSQRAVSTTQSAHPRPSLTSIVTQNVAARLTESRAVTP